MRYDGRDILLLACFIVWNYQTTFGGSALEETKTAGRGFYLDKPRKRGISIPLPYLSVPMSIAIESGVSSGWHMH